MRPFRSSRPVGWLAVFTLALGMSLSPAIHAVAWAQKPKPDAAGIKPAAGNAGAAPATGGDTGQGFNAGGAMQIAKVEGTLEALQLGVIKIATADKKEVFIQSSNDTVVKYNAEAEPEFLTPGVSVRFSVQLDATGKPTEPLKELEVFTPNVSRRLSPEQMREQMPGIYQEGKAVPAGAKNLFKDQGGKPDDKPAVRKDAPATKKPADKPGDKDSDKKPDPKRDTKRDSTAASGPAQAYRVVGKVGQVQGNAIYVIAGQPLQLEMAPDCVVQVTVFDLQSAMSLATKGDAVTVSGLRNSAQPSIVMAEQITIKAAKKLTQPEMPTRGRPVRGAKDKPSDKDDAKDAKGKAPVKKPATADKK